MKYIVMLGDGMADTPCEALGGQTPLQAAVKPHMDFLAQHGTVGMVKTVPQGMPPGSDTANLSVMGYDPKIFYSGRSPLEAVSMGIELVPTDVTFRCNLVQLVVEDRFEDAVMGDYSAGEISTEEARELITTLKQTLDAPDKALYAGISYRHCLVLHDAKTGSVCTPPHDILGKKVTDYLPRGLYGEMLLAMMKRSYTILKDHPINQKRMEKGLAPANCCWFWGEGTKPALEAFDVLYGKKAGVISAVDLIKGIGLCAGMQVAEVEGATGNLDTNFKGKADAAIKLLEDGCDMVYIHVEAPDECGHQQQPEGKVKAIERIDEEILGPVMASLQDKDEPFAVLLMPDHPTPLALRTHTPDPVPFVLYRSDKETLPHADRYTEALAEQTELFVSQGSTMMGKLLRCEF